MLNKKPWKKSIFLKLLIICLVIVLPIYITGFFLYYGGSQTIQNEIYKSSTAQAEFYLKDMENELQRIQVLQYGCINDTDLNELSVIPYLLEEYERVHAINSLRNRLVSIKNSSMYIDDVCLYIPDRDITISVNSGVYKMDTSAYDMLKNAKVAQPSMLNYWNNNLYLNLTYSINNKKENTSKTIFIISVKLSMDKFGQSLAQFNTYAGSGSMLYNTDWGLQMASLPFADKSDLASISLQSLANDAEPLTCISTIQSRQYLTIYIKSQYVGLTLARLIPKETALKSLSWYQSLFWLFSLIAVVFISLFCLSMYRFIQKPLASLARAFGAVEKGDLTVSIEHKPDDEFRYIYKRFDAMVENLSTLINQVLRQKILTQKAELKQLQSQINPHFLYNSFFVLHRRIQWGDYDNALEFSKQLGDYFKFITRNAASEATLADEIRHARIYADIQAVRFSVRIIVRFDELPVEYNGVLLPRLVVQPLIENAFEHGMEDVDENGVLHIGFDREDGNLAIVIEDNGKALTDENLEDLRRMLGGEDDLREVTGMQNIHLRIKLMFGQGFGLRVGRSELGGLRIAIMVPLGSSPENGREVIAHV